jgi:hypothetical protein
MDWDDEAHASIVEGSVVSDGDNDYGYGNPLDELEDGYSDNPEDDNNNKEEWRLSG